MQTTVQPAPAAPPSPALAPLPPLPAQGRPVPDARAMQVTVTQAGEVIAVPQNPEDLAALRTRQSKISDQLISASNRRKDVAIQLEKAHDPANQNGLQQRLVVLDGRIARLEGDLEQVGRAIAAAPAAALVGRGDPGAGFGGRSTEAAQIVSVVVPSALFFVLAMTAMGMWFKRRGRTAGAETRSRAEIERLDRLESAVETIAVEMERVSEGQRFVTRLLTEGRPGQAPVFGAAREGEKLPVAARSEQGR